MKINREKANYLIAYILLAEGSLQASKGQWLQWLWIIALSSTVFAQGGDMKKLELRHDLRDVNSLKET